MVATMPASSLHGLALAVSSALASAARFGSAARHWPGPRLRSHSSCRRPPPSARAPSRRSPRWMREPRDARRHARAPLPRSFSTGSPPWRSMPPRGRLAVVEAPARTGEERAGQQRGGHGQADRFRRRPAANPAESRRDPRLRRGMALASTASAAWPRRSRPSAAPTAFRRSAAPGAPLPSRPPRGSGMRISASASWMAGEGRTITAATAANNGPSSARRRSSAARHVVRGEARAFGRIAQRVHRRGEAWSRRASSAASSAGSTAPSVSPAHSSRMACFSFAKPRVARALRRAGEALPSSASSTPELNQSAAPMIAPIRSGAEGAERPRRGYCGTFARSAGGISGSFGAAGVLPPRAGQDSWGACRPACGRQQAAGPGSAGEEIGRYQSPPRSLRRLVWRIGPPCMRSSVTTVTIRPRGSKCAARLTSRCGVPRFSSRTVTLGKPRARICAGVNMPRPAGRSPAPRPAAAPRCRRYGSAARHRRAPVEACFRAGHRVT